MFIAPPASGSLASSLKFLRAQKWQAGIPGAQGSTACNEEKWGSYTCGLQYGPAFPSLQMDAKKRIIDMIMHICKYSSLM